MDKCPECCKGQICPSLSVCEMCYYDLWNRVKRDGNAVLELAKQIQMLQHILMEELESLKIKKFV
jgi:hypothetical protein